MVSGERDTLLLRLRRLFVTAVIGNIFDTQYVLLFRYLPEIISLYLTIWAAYGATGVVHIPNAIIYAVLQHELK